MRRLGLALSALPMACATGGAAWLNEPLATHAWGAEPAPHAVNPDVTDPSAMSTPRAQIMVLHESPPVDDRFVAPEQNPAPSAASAVPLPKFAVAAGGRVLGTFRNTYYDFPGEPDFDGASVALKNASCKTIKAVPRSFYEAVCVQGSGTLTNGRTVSFAKRDCPCAEICPRTGQRICFDELDAKSFPWGRGATGRAITPLLTVAVDSGIVPLDTPIYVPEYDGVPRDERRSAVHDGCFIAQDRGVRVQGQHLDIFTGQREITALWNRLVPSNRGVTVVLDSPHCARASAP